MKNSTKLILDHIAKTTTYRSLEVYEAYQLNMEKYSSVLDEEEIANAMETLGIYSMNAIAKLANAGD